MKKTSIYILSILVIIVLGCSVLLPSGQIFRHGLESFTTGVEDGYEEKDIITGTHIPIQFSPAISTMIQPGDSIEFDDGQRLPVVIDSMSVIVPDEKIPSWTNWASILLMPIQIILLCIIIWKFVKFILNVSKSRIFVRQNVRYLRQTSILLLIIALLQLIGGIVQECVYSQFTFLWKGYELGALWTFPWSNLLMGVFGLLLAQIWSYGLEIKEEHELTI